MIFNSYNFFIFFALIIIINYLLPSRHRWILLLAASYYFYMCWIPQYVLILLVATLIDYFLAHAISRTSSGKNRKRLFLFSLILSIGTLFLFKYFNFFSGSLKTLLSKWDIVIDIPSFELLLPIGLSYYTFKKISYITDVYRGNLEPEKHLGKFALYIAFFPEVTAGPIDRAKDLLSQIHLPQSFDFDRVVDGFKLFLWGIFKKVVIADRLALVVDQVYKQPEHYVGITLTLATIYFSIQIYADFSGYTDMAIGIGQILGYRLADNFNRPYYAKNINEFWRRWHISFTSWLRDYLFLPVAYGLSRKIKKPMVAGIKAETWAYITGTMITMLICGLWHGAGWTFVVWGGFHGLYMVFSFATRKIRKKWRKKLIPSSLKPIHSLTRILLTFSMVSFLWIFFRADSLTDAFTIISRIFNPANWILHFDKEWLKQALFPGQLGLEFLVVLVSILVMFWAHFIQPHEGMREMFSRKSQLMQWLFFIILVMIVFNLGVIKEVPFIYAEF